MCDAQARELAKSRRTARMGRLWIVFTSSDPAGLRQDLTCGFHSRKRRKIYSRFRHLRLGGAITARRQQPSQ
jgi:hypothetical protein